MQFRKGDRIVVIECGCRGVITGERYRDSGGWRYPATITSIGFGSNCAGIPVPRPAEPHECAIRLTAENLIQE